MNWVENLLSEYKDGRRSLQKKKLKLGNNEKDRVDKTQINSMINDMSYVIKWLETGRNPDELRGVNIKNIYRLRYLENMDLLPDISQEFEREQLELTEEKKKILVQVFASLSDRERDCFILHVTQEMSMAEIAKELKISKSAVQIYINRAKDKINRITKKAS